MEMSKYKKKAIELVNRNLKEVKSLVKAKETANNYCSEIINDIEHIENNDSVLGFYLLVRHEVSKVEAPF
jgi:hypothetical protein